MNDFNDATLPDSLSRRKLIAVAGAGIASAGLPIFALAGQVQQPEADSGHEYPMAKPHAHTEKDFRMGVIGPATLSRIVSEMAVNRAQNEMAKEFANFELREAIAVTTVLKELNTPVPKMDAIAKETLSKIKNAKDGVDFDKTYITAQLANHEFLRDLAEIYLSNSQGHSSMAEMHGRHLATLALATFKEHVVHTKHILSALKS